MNRRPGQVKVTTEVAFCSFCARPRTLRREERHLGTLVRTTVTCETCHRTLSSTIGVASAEPAAAAAEQVSEPPAETPAELAKPLPTAKKPAPARPASKPAASKAKAPATRRSAKSK